MTDIKVYENNNQVMAYSPQQVIEQVTAIQNLMEAVMKPKEHYGKIPGCGDKPALFKAGAEKIQFMFRLSVFIEGDDRPIQYNGGHIGYVIKTRLIHIPTGQVWGEGVGSCSTLETRYRYRTDMKKDEDGSWCPVPKAYWKKRDPEIIGGAEWDTIKKGSGWFIYRKVEHDNPSDYYNTVLKMAKKRSHIDAVLTATAASDFFTQDIEDLKANGLIEDDKVEEKRKIEEMKENTTYTVDKEKITTVEKKGKKNEPEMTKDEFNDKLSQFEHKMLTYFENRGDADPVKAMTEWMYEHTKLQDKKTGELVYEGSGTVDGIKSIAQLNTLKGKFVTEFKISRKDWDKLKENQFGGEG